MDVGATEGVAATVGLRVPFASTFRAAEGYVFETRGLEQRKNKLAESAMFGYGGRREERSERMVECLNKNCRSLNGGGTDLL